MWRISSQLNLTCVYRTQRISYCSSAVRVTIRDIYRNGKKITSAYVGPNTRIVYRSESARMVWFIQMSEEMWHFEESGQVIFHKMINSFLPDVFKKWKEKKAHHVVTIVLFTSVGLSKNSEEKLGHGQVATETRDYFRVVVDQVHISRWSEIMERLRAEFCRFDKDVLLQEDGRLEGKILPAVKGNLLQAISIASSLASRKFTDRDLRRTSVQTLIITPGAGIFDVDYDLMYQTSLKLLSIEIGVDLICLGRPPLHVTPLLRYKTESGVVKHCIPSWLDISFWESTDSYTHQWIPRCKIYEIQMMGVMEVQVSSISIDYLPKATGRDERMMEEYDASIFKSAKASRARAMFDEAVIAPKSFDKELKQVQPSMSNVTARPVFSTTSDEPEEEVNETATVNNARKSALTSLLAFGVPKSPTVSPVLGPTKSERSLWSVTKKASSGSLRSLYNSGTVKPVSEYITGLFNRDAPKSPEIPPAELSPAPDSTSSLASAPAPVPVPVTRSATHPKNPLPRVSKRPSLLRQHTDPKLKRKDPNADLKEGEVAERHSMWMTIANPSNVPGDKLINISNYGRWQFAYPKKAARRNVKWRTLQSPAALPLLTNIFPSARQFFENYRFQIYDVMLYPGQSEYQTIEELLREVVAIRLSMGFQIVSKDRVRHVEAQSKPYPNPKAVVEVLPEDASDCRIYMSMGTSIHRIACDGTSINIQMYSNMDLPYLTFDRKYHPFIKTQFETKYKPTTIDFFGTNVRTFNWNQIDHVLTGNAEQVMQQQKGFRIRFVLVPVDVNTSVGQFENGSDKLTPEEIRLEGIKRLLLMLHKGKHFTKEERRIMDLKKMNAKLPEIKFYTGSLSPFLIQLAERYKKTDPLATQKDSLFIQLTERFQRSIPLPQLAQEIQGAKGIRFYDRRWHWKTHYHCFTGSELVTWLLTNFNDIETAEDAVEYGNKLMSEGLFRHVEDRHDFKNGHYFYQLRPEYDDRNAKLSSAADATSESATSPSQPTAEASVNHLPKILLSRSLRYNVDLAKRSHRPEILTFHLDRVHNPKHCFQLRLEWLNTTPKLIDEAIISIGRLTEQYGLKLAQVPISEISQLPQQYPFVSLYRTRLALDPVKYLETLDLATDFELKDGASPLDDDPLFYHRYMLRRLGYFLDIEPILPSVASTLTVEYSWGTPTYTAIQYVHKSGMGLVQVLEDGELVFMPNFLWASRVGLFNTPHQQQAEAPTPESLRLELKDASANVKYLEDLIVNSTKLWAKRHNAANDVDSNSSFQ